MEVIPAKENSVEHATMPGSFTVARAVSVATGEEALGLEFHADEDCEHLLHEHPFVLDADCAGALWKAIRVRADHCSPRFKAAFFAAAKQVS